MMEVAGAQKASGWASTSASPCDGPKGSVNNGIAGTLIPCSAVIKPNMSRGGSREAPIKQCTSISSRCQLSDRTRLCTELCGR